MLKALKDAISNMGFAPTSIYSDDEGSFNSNPIQNYFKEHNILHIVTRTHAAYAERAVRTIKHMLYKRMEKNPDAHWYDAKILANALVTYNYRDINSITKFTPAQARESKNRLEVKFNLELKRKHNRLYPHVAVGDKIRIYKKRGKFDKARESVWSDTIHTVEKIEEKEKPRILLC